MNNIIDIYEEFKTYLLSLNTVDGMPLHKSRRKTFIIGFLSTFQSILSLSSELLGPYQYIITFRFSQDHIETLFSKIRRMGGFNNNPPAPHFKAALKRLLCKQSIQTSKSANSLDCEATCGVFKLQWSRRKTPLPAQPLDDMDTSIISRLQNLNPISENILFYISGYIVRSLQGTVDCAACGDALIAHQSLRGAMDHTYGNRSVSKLVNQQ